MPTIDFICQWCGAKRRRWSYPDQPPKYCDKHCKARAQAGNAGGNAKYHVTPEQAAKIKYVYQTATGPGAVRGLAQHLGLPRWKVTRYAVKQGWLPRTKKEPDWTEAEIDILERNAYLSPERIARKLQAAGFRRSEAGVVIKRKRLRLLANLDGQSAASLAQCFGIDPGVVAGWIKKGLLKARFRNSDRRPGQGGDIYYIKDKWVKRFVVANPNLIDLRKVDKEWFIDLLATNF